MDRMIHLALNSLKNLRVDQRINAQNLANLQVPGFKKDMPITRSSAFLSAMDQYNSRIFTTTDDKLQFSNEKAILSEPKAILILRFADQDIFLLIPKSGGDPALSRRGI